MEIRKIKDVFAFKKEKVHVLITSRRCFLCIYDILKFF